MSENLLKTYKWLRNEFWENILHKHLMDSVIEIQSFQVEPACKPGENFCSQMIRAIVEYKVNNENESRLIKFVIKAPLSANGIDDILEKFNLFSREFAIFNSILPNVYRMLKQIGDNTCLGPHIYSALNNPKCFVFDDLCDKGYRNVDKRECFDFHHMEIIIKKIAKWHAATAVMGEKDIATMSSHRIKNVCEGAKEFHPLWISSLGNCADVVKNWPGYEHIAEKLYSQQAKTIQRNSDIFTPNVMGFNVLTHGDLWGNNIMFKYNDLNEPIDAIFVDYSLGFWGSPAIDLTYLFYSSSQKTVREVEWDQLLIIYHEELMKCLKLMKYPQAIPTLGDIHIEILRKGFYGVCIAILLVGLRLAENSEYANMAGLLGESEGAKKFRAAIYNSPEYKNIMEYLLDYFNRKGYLD